MAELTLPHIDTGPAPLRALIVGAAGSAGQNFACALRSLGVEIIAADQDEIGLARLRNDVACTTIAVDALDDDAVAALFEEVEAEFGIIDLLINVAGRGFVRTLAMMRVSRAFSARSHDRPTYIVNVARPSGPDDGLVTYAGSEVAFDRLSQGLSDKIGNPMIRVLTLHSLDSQDAFADICERLSAELRGMPSTADHGTMDRPVR